MKGTAIWAVALVAGAMSLGFVAYRTLGPSGSAAVPARPVIAPSDPRVSPGRRDGVRAGTAGSPAFRLAPPGAPPDDVAEVSFVDVRGRRMSLADFHGKVVLLNLWATWCGPCREEMPTLDRLQARLGGDDFAVIALSIDRDGAGVVRDFYEELGLQALDIYVDVSGMASILLNALGIPTTLLLDRDGHEVGRYTGPADWDGEAARTAIRGVLEGGPASPSGRDTGSGTHG